MTMPSVFFPLRMHRMLRVHRMVTLLGALALLGATQPADATTLYRCKLNGRIVYSDTDCPAHANQWASSFPASKPIHISTKRKARKSSKRSGSTG